MNILVQIMKLHLLYVDCITPGSTKYALSLKNDHHRCFSRFVPFVSFVVACDLS